MSTYKNPTLGDGGLHHVAIRTHDLDASVKFYADTLGMKTVLAFQLDVRKFAQLDTGDGTIIELMQDEDAVEPAADRNVHWHYALKTSRIEDVVAAVEAAGMQVTVPVKSVTLENTATDPPSPVPVKIAFFIGPSGEVVELFQAE